MDEPEVARAYGTDFASRVMEASGTGWIGPIQSEYGFHLVQVRKKTAKAALPYEEVAKKVKIDLEQQRSQLAGERFYEGLRARYDVRVEGVEIPGLDPKAL